MAKSEKNFSEKQTWGTCEELLLAYAVHRYGGDCWDSVANELQKRTSLLFTPISCQQKFLDLKRRFAQNDAVNSAVVPWLDELRKLRVDELRREVEQYDLSIVSLQLKVEKLKEEREQSLRENENQTEKLDLKREKESERKEDEEENEPEDQTGKPVRFEEEYRSVNESNSTDPKDESPGTVPETAKIETDQVEPGKEVENAKAIREDSCNGSCDSVAKEPAVKAERVEPGGELGHSPESFAESKGEEGNRESSDVQSSARLSGKEMENSEPYEPDEPENEELDQSPAIKEVSIESQPLVELLEIFRTHKLGSLFERRLESQETPDYLNTIRQHMDLETVRMRFEEGWYSGCKSMFFRDLLLLVNNAIVFFGKKSSEYTAAIEFRQLVLKEIGAQVPNSNVLLKERLSMLPESQIQLKPEPELSLSLSMKPKLSVPLIACRKRSSITAKASTSSSGQEKRRQSIATLMNEKPALEWKQQDKPCEKLEESLVTKKISRERSASAARKGNKNVKDRDNPNSNKNSDVNTNAVGSSKGGSSNENSGSKGEKEKANTNVSSKKRSAANFLNRMRGSSSNNGPLIETLKGVNSDNGKGDGGEQKKNSNTKKDQISTPQTRSGGKKAKKRGSPAKSTGRPRKRAPAAASSPATPPVSTKRGMEVVENDSGNRQAKKRSRK